MKHVQNQNHFTELSEPERVLRTLELLDQWGTGDSVALDELFSSYYQDLHKIAHFARVEKSPRNHLAQTTEILHAVYLRLRNQRKTPRELTEFMAAAARLSRYIALDQGRKNRHAETLGRSQLIAGEPSPEEFAASSQQKETLDEALGLLKDRYPVHYRVIELRTFSALSASEIQHYLNLQPNQYKSLYAYGKKKLRDILKELNE